MKQRATIRHFTNIVACYQTEPMTGCKAEPGQVARSTCRNRSMAARGRVGPHHPGEHDPALCLQRHLLPEGIPAEGVSSRRLQYLMDGSSLVGDKANSGVRRRRTPSMKKGWPAPCKSIIGLRRQGRVAEIVLSRAKERLKLSGSQIAWDESTFMMTWSKSTWSWKDDDWNSPPRRRSHVLKIRPSRSPPKKKSKGKGKGKSKQSRGW